MFATLFATGPWIETKIRAVKDVNVVSWWSRIFRMSSLCACLARKGPLHRIDSGNVAYMKLPSMARYVVYKNLLPSLWPCLEFEVSLTASLFESVNPTRIHSP